MGFVLVVLTIAAGALLPVQVALNARLAHFIGGPVRASLVSFAVGGIVLFVVVAIAFRGGGHRAGDVPWWAWFGGAIGALYVVSSIVVGPRIGTTTFFGVLVATQLVVSVVLDRFGWLGFEQRPPSPLKLAGVGLLVAGAVLVRVF